MLGEGFDLPELKIAVYHEPHESFPATLQFIGRIVRTAKDRYPRAFVVAGFADAQGETRKLYDSDSDWTFLIPQMAHAAVEEERDVRQKLQQFTQERGETVLSLRSLNPYFSVRIFQVAPSGVNLAARPTIDNAVVRDNWWHDTLNCAAAVTERAQRPLWTKTIGFVESIHDLHLFYYDTRSHLLFVHSTFEGIADDLLEKLAPGVRKQLSAEEINRVLHVANSTVDYIQIGLRNIANVGPGAAAYKTLAGMGVQAAVNPADARAFTTGHLFGRVKGENRAELIGLSIAGSKVWSAQRGHLIAFVKWCRGLAEQIHTASTDSTVPPHLELLPVAQRVLVLGSRALGAVWDRICFEGTVDIIKQQGSNSKRMCSILDADLRVLPVNDSPSRLELTVESTDPECRFSAFFNCSGTPTFQDRRSIDFRIAVDDGSSPRRIYSLAEFLTVYPPTIYMSDGTVFIGQDLYEPKIQFPLVMQDCFVNIDWTGVSITREVGQAGRGRQNVQDFIEDYILRVFPRTSFLIKDHGSGEIADFIVINGNDSHLHLFHCKGSGTKKPGLRIDDMYEVVGQAVKSLQWCRRAELFDEVLARVALKPSKLIRGTAASLRKLLERSSPAGTRYTIHLVQPGLDLKRVTAGSAINSLLVNCYSWLSSTGAGVSLKVMGS
jgi:hypothetical protein